MPLLFPSSSTQTPEQVLSQVPDSASSSQPFFLTFFASIDPSTGESWCIDCRKAQPVLQQSIPEASSSLIFVGDRSEWKASPFREAFGITRIPTLVKLTSKPGSSGFKNDFASAPKLIESEILDEAKLNDFLGKSA